jgi:putative redox protein
MVAAGEPAGPATLLLPAWPPRAFAIYAYRAHQEAGAQPASALPAALAARGIAVLTVDLGSSPPPAGAASAVDRDAAAVQMAAQGLRAEGHPASLLIGHSAAAPAVLAAAASLADVRAVVTVGSPVPGRRDGRRFRCSSCTPPGTW